MHTLTVPQLVAMDLDSRQIVITIDDKVFVQGHVNNVDTSYDPPWIMIRDERGSLGTVFFPSEDDTITELSGGEVHILYDVYQITIYPK